MYNHSQMINELRKRIDATTPMVGAAIGAGMSAKAAESGGADFLMALNAGYFRQQGCGSSAALLPFANANELTWRIARQHVLPRVSDVPVFLGTCAQDPDLLLTDHLRRIKVQGMVGITNFPSVGFIDGHYREALEESGLGYYSEVEMLKSAQKAGLLTIAFCFTPDEAEIMSRINADILCLDLGFAKWREGNQEHQAAIETANRYIEGMLIGAKKANDKPYTVMLGGPIVTPRDAAQIFEQNSINGFIGGSAIERFPAAPLITQTVQEFKAVTVAERNVNRLGMLIGQEKIMQEVFERIRHVAETDVPVLIVGESGTGKELAAQELHRLSQRSDHPLISWNCGALTETLAMSELFGHEKGAFTGAMHRHIGKFEQSHQATLFMDEIAELPLNVQASLLRVLQEREIIRVGGKSVLPVDVRLIAATNRDLADSIQTGRFRLDLFYRLSTVVIRMPALRDRRGDIPLLMRELAYGFSRKYGYPVPEFPREVIDAFLNHSWPGNIRELSNALERCFILGRGERLRLDWVREMLDMAGLVAVSHNNSQAEVASRHKVKSLDEMQTEVDAAMKRHEGNKAAVARELGITRKTLYAWLQKISIMKDFENS